MRRLAIVALGAGLAAGVLGGPAAASTSARMVTADPAPAPIDVVEVSGIIDPIVVDFIDRSITAAEHSGDQAVVLQMNTPGSTVSSARLAALAVRIANSSVPITIWIGPSGSRVVGPPAQVLAAAKVTGMASKTRVGKLGPPLPAGSLDLSFGGQATALQTTTFSNDDAARKGVLHPGPGGTTVPTLGYFIASLDGMVIGNRTLHTTEVVTENGKPTRKPIGLTRFNKLGLLARLMHTVGSPPVAYLLTTIGLVLLLFEFFTAGVGVAGLVGVGALVLGAFGLSALPTRPWAVGLLIVSMLAFAVDVQTGVPRLYTGVGTFLYTLASVTLYERFAVSWIALIAGIGGVLLVFLVGMPSMVRTRFATPTIGREWMIGEIGDAVSDVDPEGIALVRGGQWKARTNRATPIHRGERLRVIAIERTTLEVEPEAGGARDHRERRRGAPSDPPRGPSAANRPPYALRVLHRTPELHVAGSPRHLAGRRRHRSLRVGLDVRPLRADLLRPHRPVSRGLDDTDRAVAGDAPPARRRDGDRHGVPASRRAREHGRDGRHRVRRPP